MTNARTCVAGARDVLPQWWHGHVGVQWAYGSPQPLDGVAIDDGAREAATWCASPNLRRVDGEGVETVG